MWIELNNKKGLTLSRQIYLSIQNKILRGTLKPGEKIPSTRTMAKDLSVSRNTVVEAYEELQAEGYIETLKGSKTIVSNNINCNQISKIYNKDKKSYQKEDIIQKLSNESNRINSNIIIDFKSGSPDTTNIPFATLSKIYKNIFASKNTSILNYSDPLGITEFRKELQKYLYSSRGISSDYKNIAIVSGATEGLSITSKILNTETKNEAIIENPTHMGLIRVLKQNNLKIVSINADEKGLDIDILKQYLKENKESKISLVYLTPSHQYPLGGILPINRRLDLINLSRKYNFYIIEDDYDSEFRYTGHPISTLYELAKDKVIYLGSFSKILFPGIRIGYAILPDTLICKFREAKKYTDVHTDSINQYVLAEFLQNGYFAKHIYKMRKIYNKKRKHLICSLKKYIKLPFDILGDASGLHIVIKFNNFSFNNNIIKKIYKSGVKIYPLKEYLFTKDIKFDKYILLGYGNLSIDQITKGILILKDIIEKET